MKKFKIIIFIILFILFCTLAFFVVNNKILSFDQAIYNFIISFKSNSLTSFFKFITKLCNTAVIVPLCILSLCLLYFKYRGVIYLNINIILSTILNLIVKEIFKIERPNVLQMINEPSYSFPSGHAMASISFYGFIIFLVINSKLSKIWKLVISILLSLLILIIGISRIYLGVHNASDIIGGYLLSIMLIILSTSYILNKRKSDL